jgi:hypothetical protein
MTGFLSTHRAAKHIMSLGWMTCVMGMKLGQRSQMYADPGLFSISHAKIFTMTPPY